MSRYDFSSFGNSAVSFPASTTTRTYREPDGSRVRVQETITRTRNTIPSFIEPTNFSRTEHIRAPPTTRVQSASKGAGAGVVTSSSEYETGPDGRPSHYASTVYKSPYGKVYRFNSHY